MKTAITHPDYADNRPPTSYILHNLLNPIAEDKLNYRRSVFLISLTIPILFYFSLKKNFKDTENVILILISSTILLSQQTKIAFSSHETNAEGFQGP